MLILLPPSEGKTGARRGKPLDLATLSHSALADQREQVLSALVTLCREDAPGAMAALDLGPTQFDLIVQNSELRQAPTAPASSVYTGVLYAALDHGSLSGIALRRANRRIQIVSALFGLLRPNDRIPAYRLSGSSRLPALGALPTFWRSAVSREVAQSSGLVVDMLSSPYAAFLNLPTSALTVKVWQMGPTGQRTAASHFNKATKGHLARTLATCADGVRSPADVADVAREAGFEVTLEGQRLDVMRYA